MTPSAIFELRDGALHLLPGSDLPEPLKGHLTDLPILLDSSWYVAQCARERESLRVELDNHDDVPGAPEAGFRWAVFEPCFDTITGELSGVRAWYE